MQKREQKDIKFLEMYKKIKTIFFNEGCDDIYIFAFWTPAIIALGTRLAIVVGRYPKNKALLF